ncbi:MAG: endolytic transglycosylase MltG [Gammaproteobacteria bacterium]|nr:endolytic transglycosylase MltG [Gammaproteobacteria bacterium]
MKKIIVISVFITLVLSGWMWSSYLQALDDNLNVDSSELDYSIKSGSSLSAVIYDLANKKIIKHPRYLLWYARLNGLSNKMKTGDYRLTNKLTTKEFLDDIFTGKVIQYSLTIIEGWSFQQLLDVINKHPQIKHTIGKLSKQEIMVKLELAGIHYEGQFLPDTYHFPKQLTDIEFLKRAHSSLQSVLNEEWTNRATGLLYKNSYEALIMASIVEKETGQASERKQIAGVFVRRLEKRMRLQTDPTVIYGMGDKYKGNIRKRDLLRDTPYNTYRRRGLPPTPIALPGRDAIHAALHPTEGNALYFVSRGDGSHQFSATLKEHNNAVIKYQLKGRARSFSSYKHKKSQ